jgi:hypothetical protein
MRRTYLGLWASLSVFLPACGIGDPSGADESVGAQHAALTVEAGPLLMNSKATGKCIDDASGSTTSGTGYQEWDCNSPNTNRQYYIWSQANTGQHDIRNTVSNMCLGLSSGSNGTQVTQTACNTTGSGAGGRDPWQLWYINDWDYNGSVELVNVAYPSQCMDLAGANSTNGTHIQGYTCNGSAAQRWTLPYNANGSTWHQDFFDDFTGSSLNGSNWVAQDMDWVNGERQCYDNSYSESGGHKTLEVSGGTLKLRTVRVGSSGTNAVWDSAHGVYAYDNCTDRQRGSGNGNQDGAQFSYSDFTNHRTPFVSARIASKNRAEYSGGKWSASLRFYTWTNSGTTGTPSGLSGMFPAWWILGHRNDEKPVRDGDENQCWPKQGASGEIDIMEHYAGGGGNPNQFASRVIKDNGCQNGDWSTYQISHSGADFSNFHTYSVENTGSDMVYAIDGVEFGRNYGVGGHYPEAMFAILNYALKDADMDSAYKEYAMEIDWVKHETWY